MKEKIIELAKELDKLYYPGIYIFLNKELREFYVGKAMTCMFNRIRIHMTSCYEEKMIKFIRKKGTGLYIGRVENEYGNKNEFDMKLKIIKYAIYLYMIEKGYKPINNISGFSHEARKKYDENKDKIDIEDFVKFDLNLFENGFKEIIIDRSYINKITDENRNLRWEINYYKTQNHTLKSNLSKLMENKVCDEGKVKNELFEMKESISQLKKIIKEIDSQALYLENGIHKLDIKISYILNDLERG